MSSFTFFRPFDDIDKSKRHLPHWEQPNVCYFLTFRTIDSIPADMMDRWQAERRQWLQIQGINSQADDWHFRLEMLPKDVRREFHKRFSKRMHDILDDCAGECLLRNPELRTIVSDALRHFENIRYRLAGFVVMPNHAHVLVQQLGTHGIKATCYSWKKFTSRKIHARLGRKGHFWQAETYDHIVRNEAEFEAYRAYLADNPIRAKLRAGEFSLYLPDLG
jgi:putative transposase